MRQDKPNFTAPRAGADATSASAAPALPGWIMIGFLLTLITPMLLPVGPFILSPHRLVLLAMFIPMFVLLLTGRAGPTRPADWLIFGSGLWAALSFVANHGIGRALEPSGIYMVESFGAYLLARLTIRSSADFLRMVKILFLISLFLLPFAIIEGVTRRNILLDLLPRSIPDVDIGFRLGIHRVQSLFSHPILFGAFVSTGLGLFWYALRPNAGFGGRVMTGVVPVIATFFSMSTGALIALVVQSILIGWELIMRTVTTRWRIFAWGAVATYILLELVTEVSPFHTLVRYASLNQGSAYNRILIFNYGMDNVWANPIFGLGLRDWVRPSFVGASVDNFWLLTAMRHGLPAFLLMAAAVVLVIRKVARTELGDPRAVACRAAFLTCLGGLIVAGGTVHYWHALLSFFFFILGSGVWVVDQTPGSSSEEVEEDTPAVLGGATPYSRFPVRPTPPRANPVAETRSRVSRARLPRN